ncbi:hypothetical protein EZ428_14265 [Pedobacter frigiditerrae]|uniref:Outer membrane protein beta-barrel domain-containing protein n=1 Tax=Pedobacter frigiditerrae TaxID=2530452 RepID=A0A4R0MTP8_9SPHI|nr:hypothetical protein [Pedobacter frigiditerrae]TCC90435.1 hypothetical protein EZ428_14265 [Pedobacter frigiditerrae]
MNNKIVIFLISFLFLTHNLKAQSYDDSIGVKFGIGGGFGITTKASPFGYAINLNPQIQYSPSDELSLNLVTGYTRLLTKDTSPVPDYDFIPLKLEIKIFPIIENMYTVGIVGAGLGIPKNTKIAFVYGGGFGYRFLNGYDLGIKYEVYQQHKNSVTYQAKADQFQLAFTYFF